VRTTARWAAGIAVGMLTLAGCADSQETGGDAASAGGGSGNGDAVLATADSDLGEIVVDGEGMTVYVFDQDSPGSGESACAGDCLAKWPAVEAGSDGPEVDGVSGEVGTITRDDGTVQVTLEGLPLYTYAADSDPGDVTGQGVGGNWWVVSPAGTKVIEAPASEPPADPGYSGGY